VSSYHISRWRVRRASGLGGEDVGGPTRMSQGLLVVTGMRSRNIYNIHVEQAQSTRSLRSNMLPSQPVACGPTCCPVNP
jgi:transposase-like protein